MDAQVLSKHMTENGVSELIRSGNIEITMTFHDSCPFHDCKSCVDPEKPPRWHVPVWGVYHVVDIMCQFDWAL